MLLHLAARYCKCSRGWPQKGTIQWTHFGDFVEGYPTPPIKCPGAMGWLQSHHNTPPFTWMLHFIGGCFGGLAGYCLRMSEIFWMSEVVKCCGWNMIPAANRCLGLLGMICFCRSAHLPMIMSLGFSHADVCWLKECLVTLFGPGAFRPSCMMCMANRCFNII